MQDMFVTWCVIQYIVCAGLCCSSVSVFLVCVSGVCVSVCVYV